MNCASCSKEELVALMEEKYESLCTLWKHTFIESSKTRQLNGLAPRCTKLGMVTGAVLHCLPALEKSVIMRKLSERSLKIIRVETSKDGQRLVGMRYPVDDAALVNLRLTMQTLKDARGGTDSSEKGNFRDEVPGPIQAKSVKWMAAPPKTMKSFFKTTTMKRKKPTTSNITPLTDNKGMKMVPSKKFKTGQPKSIASFFAKQK